MNALAAPPRRDSLMESDAAAEPGEAWQGENTAAAYSSRALACQKLGRSNEASRAAIRAISLDPKDARAWKVLARIHLDAGQHEAAQKACRRVLGNDAGDAEAREMMGEALAQKAKLAENLFDK
jgi:tetratricopeptide (TPR) repeat protein